MSQIVTVTPMMGMKGSFGFKPPFDTLIDTNLSLTVSSMRKVTEVLAAAEDPWTLYYEPPSIDRCIYDEDKTLNLPIIGFTDSSGRWFYVPIRYIASLPTEGVEYANVVVTVMLGALPVGTDLAFVKKELERVVTENIGTIPTTDEVQVSTVSIVSPEDHQVVTDARAAIVAENETTGTQLEDALVTIDKMSDKIEVLEAFILKWLPDLTKCLGYSPTIAIPETVVKIPELDEDIHDNCLPMTAEGMYFSQMRNTHKDTTYMLDLSI